MQISRSKKISKLTTKKKRMITRGTRASCSSPPPLRRTSAMTHIRFTAYGRVLARKLCMEDHAVHALFFTEEGSRTTFYVATRQYSREFATVAEIPEFEYV